MIKKIYVLILDFDIQAEFICIMMCNVEGRYAEMILRNAVRFLYKIIIKCFFLCQLSI